MKSFKITIRAAFLLFILCFWISLPAKAQETTSNKPVAEEESIPSYTVRFSGAGLPVYADPALLESPIAMLPDQTIVRIIQGPADFFARIRVADTGLEGYVDMRYLKRTDAIVKESDIYTYEEMETDIRQMQERYPGLLKVDITGTSADGRNLYALTLGNKNAARHILVHAGIHAREYTNPLLVMEQLEQCLDCYDCGQFRGTSYRELFSATAVHIIPMVNPDGIALSQFGEAALHSPELVQMVRACYACDLAAGRTSRPYDNYLARWKANARGVDLNKNFPFGFAVNTKAVLPSYAGYPGLLPLSEPESASLAAVTLQYKPSVVINYHSMGEVAYWDTLESRYTYINTYFSAYMLSIIPYKRMGSGNATGSYLDWIYSGDTPVLSITFETGNVECPLPAGQYPKIWIQHSYILQEAAWYASSFT